ncbi:MAG: hypothetical protein A3F09_00495 [Chlamydiae bacterium RIFCSPHIGHO2_12_FULL_49_11]|nr:MAG: hypothetical protein A3F09_00495 [Chlamydiae bacterium RIFCSPHIGHO2_12_FULL_49_11]
MSFLPDESDYDIRFSDLADEAKLMEWLTDEETRRWYPPSSENDAKMWARNWMGFSRFKASLTAIYKNQPVGVGTLFLMPYIKVSHMCMLYVCVSPAYRRRRVGYSLIKNCKHLAKTRFYLETMHVEVFEGCPVISLLTNHLEFTPLFEQQGYVQFTPGEFRSRLILETRL